MEKKIINILKDNGSLKMRDLFENLQLKEKNKTFPSLVNAIDSVLYVLAKLEKMQFIIIKKIVNTNPNSGSHYFEGLLVETNDGKIKITANKLHWMVERVNEIYEQEITVAEGLYGYINNNYRTNDELQWYRTRNLTIITSLLIPFLTALLTVLFTKCFIEPINVNFFSLW